MEAPTTSPPQPAPRQGFWPESTFAGHDSREGVAIPRFTESGVAAFPASPAAAAAPPTKLPKRPKGRWFVGVILVAVSVAAAYGFWQSFFRYAAYGTIEGHVVHVMPAWDGAIQHVYVREGERVEQGQLLLSQENSTLRQQQARLADELRLAQATLAAESSRVRMQALVADDRRQKAVAEYYEAWGNLLNERAQLDLAVRRVERATTLAAKHAIAGEDVESAKFIEAGLRQKVEKLAIAVEELHRRAKQEAHAPSDVLHELEPHVLRIESLRAETERCNEQIRREQIRAPVSGVVLRRNCLSGDHALASQPVLTILEEGTLLIVLYLTQEESHSLLPGERIQLQVPPSSQRVDCEVVQVGQHFQSAPQSIERHYRANQPLLPIELRPAPGQGENLVLRVGGVAGLPWNWRLLRSWLPAE